MIDEVFEGEELEFNIVPNNMKQKKSIKISGMPNQIYRIQQVESFVAYTEI